ncbi:uncharacterized protein LOC117314580 [Pecten maximus]|uniref:uncharacterized protein LOC117314580 n=1 Tax=Pecten maximus TaxID=6579 RepID=UPI0014585CCE|nr:uncharacterized protein LOC117314580 [Pecten maximus]
MPVLYKILEVLLRKHLKEITDPIQSRLQRGFTANASPLRCALLVQEALLAAKARKQDLFIAFLDAKSAFDVVPHNSLNRKLINSGVNGALWLLLRDLHQEASSCIKWDGVTSDPFSVLQGVRQGGVLSTELYKTFINDLLERLNNSGLGTKVGHLRIPAPTCADEVALIAESKEELAILINMAVDYSNREHYVLQPTKSVVMQVASSDTKELVPHHNFEINGTAMPIVKQTSHMGILRASRNQNQIAIAENIRKGRQAAYALMGPGLHGRNGLESHTACHLIRTFVLPIILYTGSPTTFFQPTASIREISKENSKASTLSSNQHLHCCCVHAYRISFSRSRDLQENSLSLRQYHEAARLFGVRHCIQVHLYSTE